MDSHNDDELWTLNEPNIKFIDHSNNFDWMKAFYFALIVHRAVKHIVKRVDE